MSDINYDEKQRLSDKLAILNTRMRQLRESKDWCPRKQYNAMSIGGTVIDNNGDPSGRVVDCFSEIDENLAEDLYYLNDKVDCIIEVLECLLNDIL